MERLHRMILVIAVASYHAKSYEMSKKYTIFHTNVHAPSAYHQFHNCQKCLLIAAGIRKFSITESALFVPQITITASQIGFMRIQTHCYYKEICANLILESSHLLEVSTHAQTSVYATPQPSETIGINQSEENIVCLTLSHVNAEETCRICLREASDSKSIGEFLFTDEEQSLNFVYVLRTLHTEEVIVKACEICSRLRNIYSDELCEAMHNVKASDSNVVVRNAKARKSNNGDKQSALKVHCVHAVLQEDASKEGKSTFGPVTDCMKCLARKTKSIVHWIMDDADPQRRSYFLLGITDNIYIWMLHDSEICAPTCTILFVGNENCYAGYHKHFDSTPIGYQISSSVPTSWRKNNKPDYYSECILVHFVLNEKCRQCISKYINGRTKFLDMTVLVEIKNKKNKEKLHHCITTPSKHICTSFLFLPNEVCLQDGKYPKIRELSVASSSNFRSAGSSSSQSSGEIGLSLRSLREMPTGTPSLSVTGGGRIHSTQMVLDGLDRNLVNRKRSVRERLPQTAEAGSSHSTSSIGSPTHKSDPKFPLLLVNYRTTECLMCLALVREVLVVSAHKKLVYIRKPIKEAVTCNCEEIMMEIEVPSINSMLPIPATSIPEYIESEKWLLGVRHIWWENHAVSHEFVVPGKKAND